MLKAILVTIVVVWVLDGVLLVIHPRGIITLLRDLVQQSGGLQRWWALTSSIGLALWWLPMQFPFQPLWWLVAGGMLGKGLFLGLAPDAWRDPVIAWCLSREDVDYRFWGMALCTLAVLLAHGLGSGWPGGQALAR